MLENIAPITKKIMIVNAILFLAKYIILTKGMDLDIMLASFSPISPNFKLYQVVTSMFMHGNFQHFLFNMFALYSFGSIIEKSIGENKYIILYFACGVGAYALHALVGYVESKPVIESMLSQGVNMEDLKATSRFSFMHGFQEQYQAGMTALFQKYPNVSNLQEGYNTMVSSSLGASGAIYGVLVAFAVLYPEAKLMMIFLPVPMKAKYFMPIMILLEFFLGAKQFSGDNVAHFAHLGGAIIGFILIKYWTKKRYRWN